VNDKSRSGATPNRGWFRKGRSGNPGGRPTASRAPQASAFDAVLERTLTVAHHGGTREIPMEEALQQQTYRDALAGKGMAQREVVKWIIKREAWLAKHTPKASRRAISLRASPDPDNADAALLLLGIAAANPARADIGADRAQLLLEPWAAQAALRRRRGGQRLTDRERNEIRHCHQPHEIGGGHIKNFDAACGGPDHRRTPWAKDRILIDPSAALAGIGCGDESIEHSYG
jgi:hypothetical protein